MGQYNPVSPLRVGDCLSSLLLLTSTRLIVSVCGTEVLRSRSFFDVLKGERGLSHRNTDVTTGLPEVEPPVLTIIFRLPIWFRLSNLSPEV